MEMEMEAICAPLTSQQHLLNGDGTPETTTTMLECYGSRGGRSIEGEQDWLEGGAGCARQRERADGAWQIVRYPRSPVGKRPLSEASPTPQSGRRVLSNANAPRTRKSKITREKCCIISAHDLHVV